MDAEEILKTVTKLLDEFNGSDDEYVELLEDVLSECEGRIAGIE